MLLRAYKLLRKNILVVLFYVKVFGLQKMKISNQLFSLLINSYERRSIIPFTIFDRVMLKMILDKFNSTSKNIVNISSLAIREYFKKKDIDNYSCEEVQSSLSKISSIGIVKKHRNYYEIIQYFIHITLFKDSSIKVERNFGVANNLS